MTKLPETVTQMINQMDAIIADEFRPGFYKWWDEKYPHEFDELANKTERKIVSVSELHSIVLLQEAFVEYRDMNVKRMREFTKETGFDQKESFLKNLKSISEG